MSLAILKKGKATIGLLALLSSFYLGQTELMGQEVYRPLDVPHDLPQIQRKDVMVHLFNWRWDDIKSHIDNLKGMGYSQILVSPPALSINIDAWWGRYQPVDYRVIDGPLGNEESFRQMVWEANLNGIRVIVDVVFNHTYAWGSPLPEQHTRIAAERGPLFNSSHYNANFCISSAAYKDPNSFWVRKGQLCAKDSDRGPMDLRTEAEFWQDPRLEEVLFRQQEYLRKLSSLGVGGYRFDAVKHMDPNYFDRLLTPEIRRDKFIFGESIVDLHHRDIDPYLSKMSLYDFPLQSTIQQSFGFDGWLSTLMDPNLVNDKKALPWDKSVTFVVNHDIPNNDMFRNKILDPTDEWLAYVFVMGRSEGVPLIYTTREVGNGINDQRWVYAHASPSLIKMTYFHNYVHGTGTTPVFADKCSIIFRRGGKGLVGINKCIGERRIRVSTTFASNQELVDVLNWGRTRVFDPQWHEVVLPSRGAVMYVAK